jgi:transposase InsO family protein
MANYPITLMCRVLGVSRSGWYASRALSRPTDHDVHDGELLTRIREIHAANRATYGSPRVHAQLVREGVGAGRSRVAGLMRAAGLKGRVRRRFQVTTNSNHEQALAPNSLNRSFSPGNSDEVWCADITHLPTASGWVYLAAIIDVGTRLIVGWSMATHMRTELVESALRSALTGRVPAATLVHHSDRGVQYASGSYRTLLETHGIACSMSRRGDCYDNAVIESFFGTFKQEWAHHHRWVGLADARASTHDYIEVFYNRQRLHSALGYRTPAEADQAATNSAA